MCANVVQIFCPFTTYSSPSRTARVPSDARSLPDAGLAEELAPDLGAVEDPRDVALVLLVGARDEQRRPGPADADGVERLGRARRPQLGVDHELLDRPGGEPPRPGPVRGGVPGPGQPGDEVGGVAAVGGVLGEERPDVVPELLRLGRQLEVHHMAPRARRRHVADRSGGTRRAGHPGRATGAEHWARC